MATRMLANMAAHATINTCKAGSRDVSGSATRRKGRAKPPFMGNVGGGGHAAAPPLRLISVGLAVPQPHLSQYKVWISWPPESHTEKDN